MGRPRSCYTAPGDNEVKEQVRERDGHRCRDCGMDAAEHIRRYNSTLEVHRLFPGFGYVDSWCVTLCIPCHAKKPKRLQDVVDCPEEHGLGQVWFNLYLPEHRQVWERLKAMTVLFDGRATPEDTARWVIMRYLDEHPPEPDYVI